MAREKYLPIVSATAAAYSIDPNLLDALVQVESHYDPFAVRVEAAYKFLHSPEIFAKHHRITQATEVTLQRMSWGLTQIMGATARYMGFKGQLAQLCDVEINLDHACRYLKKIKVACRTDEDLVSAYNAGSVRKAGDGTYVNQGYVDKVMSIYLKR